MREAGRLPSESVAQRFADFLLTEGIDSRVESEDDGTATLWVVDEDHLGTVRATLEVYLANTNDPRFGDRGARAAEIRKLEEQQREKARRQFVNLRRQWRRSPAGRQPVTMALLLISVGVALGGTLGDWSGPLGQWLTIASVTRSGGYLMAAPGLSEVFSGQVWRLVTPIFLHGDFLHILFNMMWLYQLGNLIEARKGSGYFLLLVLVIAIPSNVIQLFVAGPLFGGMSGVDFGLLGYVWLKGQLDPGSGMGISQGTMIFMLGWLLLGLTGFMNMANGAHLGGLVMGLIFAGAPILWRRLH